MIGLYLYSQFLNVANLIIQNFFRQSVIRDAIAQHTACLGSSLKERHRVASPYQFIGASHACWP